MQFRFKIQQYQTDAALAVTDVFSGQPNTGNAVYLRDVGSWQMQSLFDLQGEMSEGYGNAKVVLSQQQLLDNLRKVQRRGRVQESASLTKGPGAVSLDVEMETGTGNYAGSPVMLGNGP